MVVHKVEKDKSLNLIGAPVQDRPEPADSRRGDRRVAIVDAAESLFLEQGYERTSLAAIIKRSGGSLATVYELFGNKQGLLRAVVERARDMGDIGSGMCERESGAEMLREFAYRLSEHMTAPRSIALMRVVIAESLRDPEFGRAFHRDVHQSFVSDIAAAFAEWTAEGRAKIDDPHGAAELYLATVFSDAQLKAMIAVDLAPPDRARIDWRLAPFIAWFAIT